MTLPPILRIRQKYPRLTSMQITNLKNDRLSDPIVNTVSALAKKYNTYPANVMRLIQCPKERFLQINAETTSDFKSRTLSSKKTLIDRFLRKDTW
jgi:hypothetical protein